MIVTAAPFAESYKLLPVLVFLVGYLPGKVNRWCSRRQTVRRLAAMIATDRLRQDA